MLTSRMGWCNFYPSPSHTKKKKNPEKFGSRYTSSMSWNMRWCVSEHGDMPCCKLFASVSQHNKIWSLHVSLVKSKVCYSHYVIQSKKHWKGGNQNENTRAIVFHYVVYIVDCLCFSHVHGFQCMNSPSLYLYFWTPSIKIS